LFAGPPRARRLRMSTDVDNPAISTLKGFAAAGSRRNTALPGAELRGTVTSVPILNSISAWRYLNRVRGYGWLSPCPIFCGDGQSGLQKVAVQIFLCHIACSRKLLKRRLIQQKAVVQKSHARKLSVGDFQNRCIRGIPIFDKASSKD